LVLEAKDEEEEARKLRCLALLFLLLVRARAWVTAASDMRRSQPSTQPNDDTTHASHQPAWP
jgi:hypothetical protein